MKKIAKFFLIVLFVLVAMPIPYAQLAYPAEYINHVLRWDDADVYDVYDYQKLPERALDASDSSFELSYKSNPHLGNRQ